MAAGEAGQESEPAATPVPDRNSPRGWYTVSVLSVVAMLSYIDRGVLALFVQPLKRDFGLSDTEVSLLLGLAFTLPAVVVGIPASRLIDSGVRRTLIAGCLALWSVATAICGLAQNFWTLFVCRAVIGGSESVNTSASLSVITDSVRRERLPRAFAIQSAGVMIGSALSLLLGGLLYGLLDHLEPIVLPGFGTIHNWQLVFMILGLPGIFVAVLMMVSVPEPPRKGGTRPEGYPIREVIGYLIDQRGMHLRLFFAMVLFAIINVGLSAWLPAFYQRTYGWGPEKAGPIMGAVSLVCSLLGLFAGAHLAERFGKRNDDANLRVILIAQGLSLPLHLIAPLMPNPWLALGLNAVAGIVAVMGGPAYYAAIQLTTPNEMRGQIAMLYAAGMTTIGGTVGPMLVAVLTDNVARSEADLRYVLVGVNLLVVPPALYLIWRALGPYARLYRERVDAMAGGSAAGSPP
jgi:MFS family permease